MKGGWLSRVNLLNSDRRLLADGAYLQDNLRTIHLSWPVSDQNPASIHHVITELITQIITQRPAHMSRHDLYAGCSRTCREFPSLLHEAPAGCVTSKLGVIIVRCYDVYKNAMPNIHIICSYVDDTVLKLKVSPVLVCLVEISQRTLEIVHL